jgi:rhizosphere induced protein
MTSMGDDMLTKTDNTHTATRTSYSLTLVNESAKAWSFFVYQQMPEQPDHLFSLVWQARIVSPGQEAAIEWATDYGFVWSDSGTLMPGVNFLTQGTVAADPHAANTTTFNAEPSPNFTAPQAGEPAGALIIKNAGYSSNITYAVGISMDNAAAFAMAAQPNMQNTFTAAPTYWIAAASFAEHGSVLDPHEITFNLNVSFPPQGNHMRYVFGADYVWRPD